MPAESRTKKTLLNARVNLIFYFLTLLLSFFSRKIFLDCLGAEFIGLTGTLQNLLGFLNLAELGIGSAIGYVLYKPLFDHDQEKINEIISVMGYLYRWIGLIILGAGCILACFLPLIFPSTGFPLALIYFAYFSFLASSLIGYFINYRQNLLGADQRNYVVTGYYQTMTIVKTIIQMALAYYTRSYFLWVAIELTFGIIYSFVLNWRINVTYPWLKTEVSRGKELLKVHNQVLVKTKQLFIHKIGTFVQYQTVPFLTYAICNLEIVAYYGNYTIITDKLSQLSNTFMESLGASVGNLVAEGEKNKILNVFWELQNMRYFIGGVFSFAIYVLIDPFISIWLGEKYLLPNTILYLIVIKVFIAYTRGGPVQFLNAYGMFDDIWAPVAEIIINFGVAIICGLKWGLFGILLGSISSQITIAFIWKPIYLFWKGFRIEIWKYWIGFLKLLCCVGGAFWGVKEFFVHRININCYAGYYNWFLYSFIIMVIYCGILFLTMFLMNSGMRRFVRKIIGR